MIKSRLDLLLVERGMISSRAKAQALIMAGQVRVNGEVEYKSSAAVSPDAKLDLVKKPRFVSRGGEKLEAALSAFRLNVTGFICADVGSSTGGFTDCLLQNGVSRVYAIDVGKGLLHWKLRTDPHLVVMEATNARHLVSLPEPVNLVTMDASFISLKMLLPVVKGWIGPSNMPDPSIRIKGGREGGIIALIKPQFEAGRKETSRNKGVIRDPKVHESVLLDVLTFARGQGFIILGLIRSPLLGPKGNVEFLTWLKIGESGGLVCQESVKRVLETQTN